MRRSRPAGWIAACWLLLAWGALPGGGAGGRTARAQDPVTRPPAGEAQWEFANPNFEAPVRLMVGDLPLNAQVHQMYPSPAVYDVDADGQVELVVGDIAGYLVVYENQKAAGKGDPVWGQPQRLKTAQGPPIRVSNW